MTSQVSKFRENMISKAKAVVSGEISGNVRAAKTALIVIDWENTVALFTGEALSDQELNEKIVAAIKAELSK